MRTLAKTLEYLAIAALTLTLTYYGLTPVADGIAGAMNSTAELLDNPGRRPSQ